MSWYWMALAWLGGFSLPVALVLVASFAGRIRRRARRPISEVAAPRAIFAGEAVVMLVVVVIAALVGYLVSALE